MPTNLPTKRALTVEVPPPDLLLTALLILPLAAFFIGAFIGDHRMSANEYEAAFLLWPTP